MPRDLSSQLVGAKLRLHQGAIVEQVYLWFVIAVLFMQSHQLSDPKQERIYCRLGDLVGRGAAAFYKDACYLMAIDIPLESTTHLIGHLLREIESSLRSVLKPVWEQPAQKKQSGDENHRNEILAALKVLEIGEKSEIAEIWLNLAGKENENGLHKWAHRVDLAPARIIDERFQSFWRQIHTLLDTVLDRFETLAAKIWTRLDEQLAKPVPTEKDIKLLRLNIPNSAFALGYFFSRLESPGWLEELHKQGFFSNPPGMKADVETKTFWFPIWEQSRYLIKVASHKPEVVLAITTELLASNTNNILIYEDLAEAALKMPINFAVYWVEEAVKWLKKQTYLPSRLSDKLGKLVTYLTSKDRVDAAINLAQEILTVLPQPEDSLYKKPITHFDVYYYSEIINEHLQLLIERESDRILDLFSSLLDRYLSFYLSASAKEGRIFEDHSSTWYSTFDNTSQNLHRTDRIESILTGAIWNIAKQIAEQDPEQVKNLFKKFQNYRWRIFDRICLHLLRGFPNQISYLIVERLTDREPLNWLGLSPKGMEMDYSREHALLLKEQFVNLSPDLQERIFCWLLEGPTDAMEVKVEKREEYIGKWQRDWFSVVSTHLPPPCQQRYNELVQEFGAATTLVSNTETTAWSPNSPLSEVELAEMLEGNMSKFFTYLKQRGLSELSILGLTIEIEELIASDPQKFVDQIEEFKEIEPKLVISLPQGLIKALRKPTSEQKSFLWKPVLTFCIWILKHFREIYEQNISSQGWSNLCDRIVSLIDIGLQAKELDQIPLTYRSQVWQLLEFITSDTQVRPGFTPHYQDICTDSRRASVCTVRGKAMQALVQYAFWIRQDANDKVQASQNFDDMSEVQQVLEWHLNPQQDPSSAIRAVYGRWFLHLLHLASDWTIQQINQVFPEEPELQYLFEAAWEGYMFNQLDANVFNALRRKYIHAIGQLPTLNYSSREQSETARALSYHLLNLFWYSVINLGEYDSLLEEFFAKAPAYPREEFMRHISWRLLHSNFEVDKELRQRLQNFLEWRIGQAKNSLNKIEQPFDLKYFGWIFDSGKLDDHWAITKLLDVLKLIKTVDYSKGFSARLENLASTVPQEVVQCLYHLADGNQASEWFEVYLSDSLHAILQTILQSKDGAAQKEAENLINRLLVRNLGDFRELLP